MPEKRKFKDIKLTETREAYVRVYDDELEAGDTHDAAAWEMVSNDSWECLWDDYDIVNEGEE